MAEAYIKLFKKMLSWEWYDDPNTCRLFIHCLLKANWKPGSWHGIHYEAGQFITSLNTLSVETGLSFQQTRTALEHLKSTNEITDLRQSNYRIITIVKWSGYQGDNKLNNNEVTNLQQTDNKPLTTDKEYKEYKELKELNSSSAATGDDVQEIIDCWNANYNPISLVSPTRYEALRELIRIFTIADVKRAIKKTKESKFLQSKTWFTFDWFIKQDNLAKILDGNYKDKCKTTTKSGTNYDDLARELME